MKLIAKLRRFGADENGAVTVDWVVLTAAIVGLGIGVISVIEGGVGTLASNISDAVSSVTVDTD
ncbi:MAG: hypothetical protein AAGE18_11595 [Pseudomonadota bacterium]